MSAPPDQHAEAQRVLVVDDEALNRLLLTTMLGLLDCRVEEAEGGTQALDLLQRQPFDRMFLDIRMPGMSGIELAAKLRASRGLNRDIPIVAVSGDVSRTLAQYRQIGFDGVVEKPVFFSALRASLQLPRPLVNRDIRATRT